MLAADFPTTARIDASFPADEQAGFAPEVYSATNIQRPTVLGWAFLFHAKSLAIQALRVSRWHRLQEQPVTPIRGMMVGARILEAIPPMEAPPLTLSRVLAGFFSGG